MSGFCSHLTPYAPTLPSTLKPFTRKGEVISTNHEPNLVAVHDHLSLLRVHEAGDNAHGLLPALLSLRWLWKNAHPQARRLLCVLQLRNSRLSTKATGNRPWRVVATFGTDDPDKCSDFDVARSDADSPHEGFGAPFAGERTTAQEVELPATESLAADRFP
jgi:hypothetical protein